jgi:hypothetical protein
MLTEIGAGDPQANSAVQVPDAATVDPGSPAVLQLSNLGFDERVNLIGPLAFLFPGSAGILAEARSTVQLVLPKKLFINDAVFGVVSSVLPAG